MHKAGVIAVWTGLIMTVFGLVTGFGLLFLDYDHLAMVFMTAVPFGFLFLFSGLVATQLSQPPSSGPD